MTNVPHMKQNGVKRGNSWEGISALCDVTKRCLPELCTHARARTHTHTDTVEQAKQKHGALYAIIGELTDRMETQISGGNIS